jgi:hypothetical protein
MCLLFFGYFLLFANLPVKSFSSAGLRTRFSQKDLWYGNHEYEDLVGDTIWYLSTIYCKRPQSYIRSLISVRISG